MASERAGSTIPLWRLPQAGPRASTILNLDAVLDADFPDVIRWRGEIHVTYTYRSCVGKVTLRSPPQLRGTRDHRAWQNDHLDHGRTATGRTF